jgi:hypothetical protein
MVIGFLLPYATRSDFAGVLDAASDSGATAVGA